MFKSACVCISSTEVAGEPSTFVGGIPFVEVDAGKCELVDNPAAAKKGNAAAIWPTMAALAKSKMVEKCLK